MERALIAAYRAVVEGLLPTLDRANHHVNSNISHSRRHDTNLTLTLTSYTVQEYLFASDFQGTP
jgi:hypothetical protein